MIRPYYDEDGVTIYHGDCRDVLPELSQRIDLVLTDPPFFMPATHYQSRVQYQRAWADTSILATFWAVVMDAALAHLRKTGHFITFCNGDSYPVFYPEMYRRFDFLKCLVWNKGHIGLGRVWRNQHELAIAARWDSSEFVEDGQLRADVFQFKATPSADREHPVEKPVDMLMWLIQPTTKAGSCVLDPFAGSGSTLDAAKRIGRKAVGIEAEERYCEIAAKRLSQRSLFPVPSEQASESATNDDAARGLFECFSGADLNVAASRSHEGQWPLPRRFPFGMNADDHASDCDIRTSRDGWDADCTCGVRQPKGAQG